MRRREFISLDHDPITEVGRLTDFLIDQYPNVRDPAPKLYFTPPAQHLFAGILMASDWMASGFAFDPGTPDQLAAQVIRRTAWSGWHSGAPASDLLGGRDPRPAQIGMPSLSARSGRHGGWNRPQCAARLR